MTSTLEHRIKSFVLRGGRMTDSQQKAWETQFSHYGLSLDDGGLDWCREFGVGRRRILEIGFGMGDSLAAMAEADTTAAFVGIEVHRPGVGRLLSEIDRLGLENLKVYAEDAVEVLEQVIVSESLDRIQIYFPDPWHKKRHHKRRLIQPKFVSLLSDRLRSGGKLHLATDWQPYAEHMLEVLDANAELTNDAGAGHYSGKPSWRPETKFERRGQRLGHGVWDLLYSKA
jgi:tRNA (guanine-N7-)-methyltransferase